MKYVQMIKLTYESVGLKYTLHVRFCINSHLTAHGITFNPKIPYAEFRTLWEDANYIHINFMFMDPCIVI